MDGSMIRRRAATGRSRHSKTTDGDGDRLSTRRAHTQADRRTTRVVEWPRRFHVRSFGLAHSGESSRVRDVFQATFTNALLLMYPFINAYARLYVYIAAVATAMVDSTIRRQTDRRVVALVLDFPSSNRINRKKIAGGGGTPTPDRTGP